MFRNNWWLLWTYFDETSAHPLPYIFYEPLYRRLESKCNHFLQFHLLGQEFLVPMGLGPTFSTQDEDPITRKGTGLTDFSQFFTATDNDKRAIF